MKIRISINLSPIEIDSNIRVREASWYPYLETLRKFKFFGS